MYISILQKNISVETMKIGMSPEEKSIELLDDISFAQSSYSIEGKKVLALRNHSRIPIVQPVFVEISNKDDNMIHVRNLSYLKSCQEINLVVADTEEATPRLLIWEVGDSLAVKLFTGNNQAEATNFIENESNLTFPLSSKEEKEFSKLLINSYLFNGEESKNNINLKIDIANPNGFNSFVSKKYINTDDALSILNENEDNYAITDEICK